VASAGRTEHENAASIRAKRGKFRLGFCDKKAS
jgi:hypothetical protein